ncbi:MAG: nucleotide exchange factor GrpE [Pontixanthobacter sp.]
MTDETQPHGDDAKATDHAVESELKGVPKEFLEGEGTLESEDNSEDEAGENDAMASLRDDLETAKQETLYAKAETQNVRRRMEKDVADARAYAATGFARDILSVADNLARGIDAIPEDLREDSKFKGLVTGIQATQRELDKVFAQHGISRIAAMGLPLDPNQHQAMMEVPTDKEEPGIVVQEMQAGYMIKDRLLRPAMVGVAKKPD